MKKATNRLLLLLVTVMALAGMMVTAAFAAEQDPVSSSAATKAAFHITKVVLNTSGYFAGEPVSDATVTTSTRGLDISNVQWQVNNSGFASGADLFPAATGTFRADTSYRVVITVKAGVGYTLDALPGDSVTIDGENAYLVGKVDATGTTCTIIHYLDDPVTDPAKTITQIRIGGVSDPMVGRAAEYGWGIQSDSRVQKFSDGDGDSGSWIRSSASYSSYTDLTNDPSFVQYYESGYGNRYLTFAEDFYYTFVAWIQLEDGCTIADDATATINGQPATIFQNGDRYIVFRTFDPLKEQVLVETISAGSVKEPVVGQYADFGWSTPDGAPYHPSPIDKNYPGCVWVESATMPSELSDIYNSKWYHSGESLVFREGYYYTVICNLASEDGYYFNSSVKGTVNGMEAQTEWFISNVARIFYTFGPLERPYLKTVSITGVRSPVQQFYPGGDGSVPENAHYKISYDNTYRFSSVWVETDTQPTKWQDVLGGHWLEYTETFQPDKYYTYLVNVVADDNYYISHDVNATVNGHAASMWNDPYGGIKMWYCFGKAPAPHVVNEIIVNNVVEPKVGAVPSNSFTIPDGVYYQPSGSSYSEHVNAAGWTCSSIKPTGIADAADWEDFWLDHHETMGETFEAGYYYSFGLCLELKEGTIWGDNITVKINGKEGTFLRSSGPLSDRVMITFGPLKSGLPFTDVKESDWFYDDLVFSYNNGLIRGTTETTFSPNAVMTRGMMVTLLYRMEGSPAAGENPFKDVAKGSYCEDSTAWAASKGIVLGYGDGNFKPDTYISREQMATMLYRYAKYKGYDVSARADLTKFADKALVGGPFYEALQWANAEDLIRGVTVTRLDPKGDATRTQAAVIFHRFCVNIAGW